MKNTIAQFIPIVAIYALLSQYNGCISFSHTIIGKLIAILVILFYTSIDKMIGLFVCSLILLFYQMDCVERSLNKEAFHDINGKTIEQIMEEKQLPDPDFKETKPAKSNKKDKLETFENYQDTYSNQNMEVEDVNAIQSFKEHSCKNGKLQYKGMDVNNEMTSHVFPEITFKDDYCNVCSPTCKFSIIEAKLRSEKKVKPEQTP